MNGYFDNVDLDDIVIYTCSLNTRITANLRGHLILVHPHLVRWKIPLIERVRSVHKSCNLKNSPLQYRLTKML